MSDESTAPWYAGALIADRYRLVARIAGGGMGEVWRGVDTVLDRPVAVKVLRSEHAQDADFRERLRREARAAGSISHAHAVPVYDFGDETQVNGPHLSYLVMQFVDGPALAERLHTGAIGVEQTLRVIEETASALQAAHSAGIVHRDIKPGNILLDPEGAFKITDFGIARAGDALPLTRTGMLTGTAKYLSPEQAGGKSATPASDIYSLGVVAYQCLSGRVPFEDGNEVAIALAQIQDDPPDLPPEVPASVNKLVMSMLAKDPEDRPSSAGAVVFAAQSLRGGLMTGEPTAAYAAADVATAGDATQAMAAAPVAAGIDGQSTAAMEVPHPSREQTPARAAVPRRRRPLMLLMLAVAAFALIAGVGAAFLGDSEHQVPNVIGKQLTTAKAALKQQNFVVASQKANVAGKKAGTVVAQSPTAGVQLTEDSTVELTVASGLVDVPTKSLLGKSYADAANILKKLGLNPDREDQISRKVPGTVIGVDSDSTAKIGSTVTLVVAAQPTPATVQPPQPNANPNGNKDDKKDRKDKSDKKDDANKAARDKAAKDKAAQDKADKDKADKDKADQDKADEDADGESADD